MSDKEVVRVIVTNGAEPPTATLESKDADGAKQVVPLPFDERLQKRMEGRRHQFFYATRRGDGSFKLGAYAPWQEW